MENQENDNHYNPEVNYDEATMEQQRQIEKEIVDSQLLVGREETLDTLGKEYADDDEVYQTKIEDLKQKYRCMRKIRGDGNCFYRGFGYAILEDLLTDKEEFKRFREVASKSKDELLALGFPKFTLEDFHDVFMEAVDMVGSGCSVEELQARFNDQGLSDYLVVYLRLLVSGHLQKEQEFFQYFIEGGKTVKEFCNQEVEPMGKECDHLQITALTTAIGMPLRVEYMDRNHSIGGTNSHIFPDGATPKFTLLYRPGHYDILYQ